MGKTKTTIEDLAVKMEILAVKIDNLAAKTEMLATKEEANELSKKQDLRWLATREEFKKFATKNDLKGLATKKDLEGLAAKDELENLAVITKQGFDTVDFKFAVIDDQFKELRKNDQRLENKIDHVFNEVLKNSDAFARLKNYVDAETAAIRGHLLRVDEKIGLA